MDHRRFDDFTRVAARATSRRQVLRAMLGVAAAGLFGRSLRPDRVRATPAPRIAPGHPAFLRTWERTDRPVAEGRATRTWMWGPEPFTEALMEPYAESPGGMRLVQYYDKSRMEITDPSGDPSSVWYVTNGLLVNELMTGQLQVGDAAFESRGPAQENVAGDADDPDGPTYASFAAQRNVSSGAQGALITRTIHRDGTTGNDPSLAGYNVVETHFTSETNHWIAAPFWAFMNSSGTVYEDGQFTQGQLFLNAYYATGFPVTDAYWARVRVGGTQKAVLVQCFERRCLTYTPDNPPEWQVEAGNVGRHYHTWRTGLSCSPPCNAPESCCGGQCRDLRFDNDNCGGCGDACAPNQFCDEGQCVSVSLCEVDADCPGTDVCDDGECIPCSTNGGTSCDAAGVCCPAGLPVCPPAGRTTCCEAGTFLCANRDGCCNEGCVCTPDGCDCSECDIDDDCPGTDVCDDGACVPCATTGGTSCAAAGVCCPPGLPVCPPAGRSLCCEAGTFLCSNREGCCNNGCTCTPTGCDCNQCVTDDDCDGAEVCYEGQCAPCETRGWTTCAAAGICCPAGLPVCPPAGRSTCCEAGTFLCAERNGCCNNGCICTPTGCDCTPGQCDSDADCDGTDVCYMGECVTCASRGGMSCAAAGVCCPAGLPVCPPVGRTTCCEAGTYLCAERDGCCADGCICAVDGCIC
ncbi:MAG: hypothetical protein DCC58_14475 [Chloroflexi bacterium]|nr:MAG: hypothetical protein DCC58_14475 [Chloroflexota bacterium]